MDPYLGSPKSEQIARRFESIPYLLNDDAADNHANLHMALATVREKVFKASPNPARDIIVILSSGHISQENEAFKELSSHARFYKQVSTWAFTFGCDASTDKTFARITRDSNRVDAVYNSSNTRARNRLMGAMLNSVKHGSCPPGKCDGVHEDQACGYSLFQTFCQRTDDLGFAVNNVCLAMCGKCPATSTTTSTSSSTTTSQSSSIVAAHALYLLP